MIFFRGLYGKKTKYTDKNVKKSMVSFYYLTNLWPMVKMLTLGTKYDEKIFCIPQKISSFFRRSSRVHQKKTWLFSDRVPTLAWAYWSQWGQHRSWREHRGWGWWSSSSGDGTRWRCKSRCRSDRWCQWCSRWSRARWTRTRPWKRKKDYNWELGFFFSKAKGRIFNAFASQKFVCFKSH